LGTHKHNKFYLNHNNLKSTQNFLKQFLKYFISKKDYSIKGFKKIFKGVLKLQNFIS